MKKQLTILSAALLIAVTAHSSVTINFGMGNMYSSTGTATAFPSGGLLNLLALDSGTWSSAFPNLADSLSQNTNSWTLPGTTLVGQIANDDVGGPGSTGGAFSYSYAGNFGAGDQLLLVAYPTLTLSSSQPGLAAPGFFFRTDSIIDGSDIAWVAPADGATVSLFAYTIDSGGTLANNQFTSGSGALGGSGFTTVPEPSTYALLSLAGLALGGYAVRRRRRA
jgi:hypothetical protein